MVLLLSLKVLSFFLKFWAVIVIVLLDPVFHLSVKVLVKLIVLILLHVLLVFLVLDISQMSLLLLSLLVFLDLLDILMMLNMVSQPCPVPL